MKHLFCILISLFSIISIAQNDTIFDEANSMYNEGKYAEAIDTYTKILNNNYHSPELYFNLANAHYKLNNIAPSIYYYEKALILSPNDSEIENNAAFARNMTIDAIDVIPEAGLSKILNNITNSFSFDTWAKFSVGLSFAFVILFLIYYFAYSSSKKRLAFIGSILSILFLVLALTFAFHKFNLSQNDRPAIVFAQECKVKNEPNSRSEESFRLHEGTKVQILDTVNEWKKIKLADGKTGWISSDDIKAL